MRYCIRFIIMVLLLAATEKASAQTLTLLSGDIYDFTTGGNFIAYGLYKRGCGVYTCNDGCSGGIPNHILRLDNPIVDVGTNSTGGICQQKVVVEDWYFSGGGMRSYMFQTNMDGMRLFRINDNDGATCDPFDEQTGETYGGDYKDQISIWNESIYTAGFGGLYELALDTANDALSLVDSTSTHFGMGVKRVGDYVYEIFREGTINHAVAPDSFKVYIRAASNLDSIVAQLKIDLDGDPAYIDFYAATEDMGFSVVRDTFSVGGSKAVRIAGILAFNTVTSLADSLIYQYSRLIALDFGSGSTINKVYDERFRTFSADTAAYQAHARFCDLEILDRKVFIAGSADSGSLGDLGVPGPAYGFLSVYDISKLDSIQNLDYLRIIQTLSMQSITDTALGIEVPSNIHVSRNYYWDRAKDFDTLWTSNSDSAWIADGTYTIYTNWVVNDTAGDHHSALWQTEFEPAVLDSFVVGDLNNSHSTNILDLIVLNNYLSSSGTILSPVSKYDMNSDGYLTFADLRTLNAFLFYSAKKPGNPCNICP